MQILKTIKLFIGGEFPRTESGRSYQVTYSTSGKVYAELCRASRKDLRNAVSAALSTQGSWSKKSAYNRSQILYRMAEMMEGKRFELQQILVDVFGLTKKESEVEITQAIDAFVYYAGFADKFSQVIGAVNPVSGPHHNFTSPEAVGVVGLIFDEEASLTKIVSDIAAIVVSGNTLVTLLPAQTGVLLAVLAEIFATSDLPKGTINILSGFSDELNPHFASHMEIDAISYQGSDHQQFFQFREFSIENMKRISGAHQKTECLDNILNYVEYKTVWHPIGC